MRTWPVEEETQEFWRDKTKASIERALKKSKNQIVRKAKNVIIFLGDGMGLPSVTAGRILTGYKFKVRYLTPRFPLHQMDVFGFCGEIARD